MKYLVSDNGTGYIFSGIMKGIKMGIFEALKEIIHEKKEEIGKN